MLIMTIKVKLKKNIQQNSVFESIVTVTSKRLALLANQFIETCKTHAQQL